MIILVALFTVFSICQATSVTTVSNIASNQPTAGYVIYAKTITASASGNTEVVAAITGKKIKVIAYELIANGDTNVKFQSSTNDISGSTLWYLATNSGVAKPVTMINNQPIVLLQTNSGEALNVNLSASQSVSGSVLYYVE